MLLCVVSSSDSSWDPENFLGHVGIATDNIMDQKRRSLRLGIWNLDVSIDPVSQFVLTLPDLFCSVSTSPAAYLDRD